MASHLALSEKPLGPSQAPSGSPSFSQSGPPIGQLQHRHSSFSPPSAHHTHAHVASSSSSFSRPPRKLPPPPSSSPPSLVSPHLLALFILFSVFGTLARLGLTALFTYDGQGVFPLIWSQAVGCFLMGACSGRKQDLERWVGPVGFVGLTTGSFQQGFPFQFHRFQ